MSFKQVLTFDNASVEYSQQPILTAIETDAAALEQSLQYWKEALHGMSPLELPTDYSRPATPTYRRQSHAQTLGHDRVLSLKRLGQEEGVTLGLTLLAAFKVLLGRLSGQEDIGVGSSRPMAMAEALSMENNSSWESQFGGVPNTLVLRTHVSQSASFRELLGRVRQTAAGAYAHKVPFEMLVAALYPEQDGNNPPVFQVGFTLFSGEGRAEALVDWQDELLSWAEPCSRVDMALSIREEGNALWINLVSNADLFSAARMEVVLEQYVYLLQQLVTAPETPISQVSLVPPATAPLLPNPQQRLPHTVGQVIYHEFVQQCDRRPQQTAIVDAAGRWTYEVLNQRSNQLAHFLLQQGIQPQDLVAIYASRSASLVWAMLGILKAGAAVMVLDSAYPAARLREYVALAQPKGLLILEAAGAFPAELAQPSPAQPWICQLTLPAGSQSLPPALAECSTAEPPVVPHPEHRAYVAFTSGSTGTPKAIVGTHSPISHFLTWYCRTFLFTAADHFSLLSGLAHDPLWRDIFTPLHVGATLSIPSPAAMEIPSELIQWMQRSEISAMHLTPAMGQLIREGATSSSVTACQLPMLRHACFGGDILTRQGLDALRELAPQVTCVNGYGATETPQLAGHFVIPPLKDSGLDPCPGKSRLPVGKGIEGTQLLILNSAQGLAGIGELGEIYVRTPYLSQGYLDGSLNHERFVVNPFTGKEEDICYKTGDYGRYLPDGQVEILGRMDHQIKIRGFRIELGEIESALSQHPAIQQSIVVAREDKPGQPYLVAYIVASEGDRSTMGEWRQFLRRSLPDYMIPSTLVRLAALPLTPNGKIDRRALPKPEPMGRVATTQVPPQTPTEIQLAQIWAEVLALPSVGVTDNFFDLGGHSLLTVRLTAQIEKQFGIKLPLSAVLTTPTIQQLAVVLDHETAPHRQDPLPYDAVVPLRPGSGQPPLFLIHDVDGETLVYRTLAHQLDPAIPVYALRPPSAAGYPLLHTRIDDMVKFYVEQIRQVQPEGPYFLGGLCAGGTLAFEIALRFQQQGQRIGMVALIDAADGSAPEHGGDYVKSQRLSRLSQVLANSKSLHPHQRIGYIASEVWKKLTNALLYEAKRRYLDGRERIRLHLFRYCLDRNRRLPPFLRHIPVRTLLNWAGTQYPFDGILEGGVLLIRATEKSTIFDGTTIDDTPLIEKYADPLLGWAQRVTQGVQACDIPGGHSSMLQEPHVQILAAHMQTYMDQALAQTAVHPDQASPDHPLRARNRDRHQHP